MSGFLTDYYRLNKKYLIFKEYDVAGKVGFMKCCLEYFISQTNPSMAVASYSICISSMYILLLYILVSVLNNDLKAVC